MKILFYDIETSPLLAHVWHPWGDFVRQEGLLNDQFVLTWAAKWSHQKGVKHDRLTSEEAKSGDDSRIVETLSHLIRQADVIVAHNGDRFDLPIVNKRLLLNELDPLPPARTVDTLKLARKNFKFEMNKLDFLADRLGLGRKTKTEFSWWKEAYQGDENALRKLDLYCRRDVRLLEQVFDRMKPYVKGLTRLVDGLGFVCPHCASENVRKQGVYYTQSATYQRYQCKDCSKWSREPRRDPERVPDLRPL